MSVNLLQKLAIVGVILCVAPACQRNNPARPSLFTPQTAAQTEQVSLTFTGMSGSFVGLANELCDGGTAVAIDDLKVDYEVSGRSLAGALLVACPTDDCEGATPLGTIAECPVPPNPCEAGLPAVSEGTGSACLVGEPTGTGSVHVYATRPADAEASWHVMAYFQDSDHSNTVSATVEPPAVVVPADSSMDSARFVHSVQIHR